MSEVLATSFHSPVPCGPVTLSGPFVAWAYVYRVSAGLTYVLGDTDPNGTGSAIYINGDGAGITACLLGSFATDGESLPETGYVLLRIRRDEDNVIFLTFTGQEEFQAHGPSIAPATLTFNAFNGYYATDEQAAYESDDSAFLSSVRIFAGVMSAEDMAAYETALTGAVL
jgi:hypothetical protein